MIVQTRPAHPSTWLFGEAGSVQVWAVDGDARVRVSVLIGQGCPIILLNRLIAESERERDALDWAFRRIACAEDGYYVLRA